MPKPSLKKLVANTAPVKPVPAKKAVKKVSKSKETAKTESFIFETHEGVPYAVVSNAKLISRLREVCSFETLYKKREIYKIPIYEIFSDVDDFQNVQTSSYPDCKSFFAECGKYRDKLIQDITSMNKISFFLLPYLFKEDKEIVFLQSGLKCGGIITSTHVAAGWGGTRFVISYKNIGSNGKTFLETNGEVEIPLFKGNVSPNELPVQFLSPEEKDNLNERGLKLEKYCIGNHYVSYSGEMLFKSWFGDRFRNAGKKVQIDKVGFDKISSRGQASDDSTVIKNISEDSRWMIIPWIEAFSYKLKDWGLINIEQVSEFQFNPLNFDKIVLDPEKKKVIKSLITHYNSSFKDIIAEKSGGCIFLLHGTPGVGKTLTAETVADYLKRPLYPITVGELGTNAKELEENLTQVLDIVSSWNAVLLIDEADLFLEERTANDIERNALVSIFLRLLEYHQGIIFLTTNRAKNLDQAFHSRITLTIKYDALDDVARQKVWVNLLKAAELEIDEKSIAVLSKVDMNGREIKNAIRLTQCICKEDNRAVDGESLVAAINLKSDLK